MPEFVNVLMDTDLEPFLPVSWLAPASLGLTLGNVWLRMITSTPVFRNDSGPHMEDRYVSTFEDDDPYDD